MIFLGGDFSKKTFQLLSTWLILPGSQLLEDILKMRKIFSFRIATFHVTDYKSCESSPNVPLKYKWVGRSQENIATVKPWSIGFRGADLSSSTVKNPYMTFDFSKT